MSSLPSTWVSPISDNSIGSSNSSLEEPSGCHHKHPSRPRVGDTGDARSASGSAKPKDIGEGDRTDFDGKISPICMTFQTACNTMQGPNFKCKTADDIQKRELPRVHNRSAGSPARGNEVEVVGCLLGMQNFERVDGVDETTSETPNAITSDAGEPVFFSAAALADDGKLDDLLLRFDSDTDADGCEPSLGKAISRESTISLNEILDDDMNELQCSFHSFDDDCWLDAPDPTVQLSGIFDENDFRKSASDDRPLLSGKESGKISLGEASKTDVVEDITQMRESLKNESVSNVSQPLLAYQLHQQADRLDDDLSSSLSNSSRYSLSSLLDSSEKDLDEGQDVALDSQVIAVTKTSKSGDRNQNDSVDPADGTNIARISDTNVTDGDRCTSSIYTCRPLKDEFENEPDTTFGDDHSQIGQFSEILQTRNTRPKLTTQLSLPAGNACVPSESDNQTAFPDTIGDGRPGVQHNNRYLDEANSIQSFVRERFDQDVHVAVDEDVRQQDISKEMVSALTAYFEAIQSEQRQCAGSPPALVKPFQIRQWSDSLSVQNNSDVSSPRDTEATTEEMIDVGLKASAYQPINYQCYERRENENHHKRPLPELFSTNDFTHDINVTAARPTIISRTSRDLLFSHRETPSQLLNGSMVSNVTSASDCLENYRNYPHLSKLDRRASLPDVGQATSDHSPYKINYVRACSLKSFAELAAVPKTPTVRHRFDEILLGGFDRRAHPVRHLSAACKKTERDVRPYSAFTLTSISAPSIAVSCHLTHRCSKDDTDQEGLTEEEIKKYRLDRSSVPAIGSGFTNESNMTGDRSTSDLKRSNKTISPKFEGSRRERIPFHNIRSRTDEIQEECGSGSTSSSEAEARLVHILFIILLFLIKTKYQSKQNYIMKKGTSREGGRHRWGPTKCHIR